MVLFFEGDLKQKLKKGKLALNNTKIIGNSFTGIHPDNRIESDYLTHHDEDTYSNKSYGSHKKRGYKDESHKGSMDTLDGEEKRDASKEDLENEGGKILSKFMKLL